MPWVDISEAAFTLGVSERTIRNWIKSGKLQARSSGGRREVEIPEPDKGQTAQAFADDETEGGQPIEVQKRLEVALIECGRVKGTLASQERMMENLSANIAELNAKLQKSERVIGRRTLWCVIIAFLGVGAYSLSRAWYNTDVHTRALAHQKQLREMEKEHGEKLDQRNDLHRKEMKEFRTQKDAERQKALSDMEARLSQEYNKKLEDLRERLGSRINELEEANRGLSQALEEEKKAHEKVAGEMEHIRKDLENAEARRADTERLVDLQKSRLEEAEKTCRELEEELAKWKKHYDRPHPPSR